MEKRSLLSPFLWTLIVVAILTFAIGCGPLTLPHPHVDPNTDLQNTTFSAADIWDAVAIAAEHQTISKTTQLGQVILTLAKNGNLSAKDVQKFDQAFPDISRNERTLTPEDIQRLRGLQ